MTYACICMPRHIYVDASICMHARTWGCMCIICKRICACSYAYSCICPNAFVCTYPCEVYVCICMPIPSPPRAHPHRGGRHSEKEHPTLGVGRGGPLGPYAYTLKTYIYTYIYIYIYLCIHINMYSTLYDPLLNNYQYTVITLKTAWCRNLRKIMFLNMSIPSSERFE